MRYLDASMISITSCSMLRPSRIARAVSRSTRTRGREILSVSSTRWAIPGGLGRRLTSRLASCSGVSRLGLPAVEQAVILLPKAKWLGGSCADEYLRDQVSS